MKAIVVPLLAAVLCACSKSDTAPGGVPGAATSAPPVRVAETRAPAASESNAPAVRPSSTLQTAVDGFTGRTAVNAGRKAQDKIRSVAGDRDKEMKEVDSFGR